MNYNSIIIIFDYFKLTEFLFDFVINENHDDDDDNDNETEKFSINISENRYHKVEQLLLKTTFLFVH